MLKTYNRSIEWISRAHHEVDSRPRYSREVTSITKETLSNHVYALTRTDSSMSSLFDCPSSCYWQNRLYQLRTMEYNSIE